MCGNANKGISIAFHTIVLPLSSFRYVCKLYRWQRSLIRSWTLWCFRAQKPFCVRHFFITGNRLCSASMTFPEFQWASSVQFSCSVVSDSLQPHGLQHPGFPVHHQLPELTQTHVHWVGDAIQPSHPLSSPSTPAFNLSQNQGLFQWVSSSHQVANVLEFQLQHQSFQWIFRTDFL